MTILSMMTLDSKTAFARFPEQLLKDGILRKYWLIFHHRSLLGRYFRGYVLHVLKYFSAVWCSAADKHFKLLDSVTVVSGASFLTEGVFECYTAHRRSVAVLCMLYKIRCNSMHPLDGALPVLYEPVRLHVVLWFWSHIGILMRLLGAEPRSTSGPLFHSQCPCGTILLTLYSMMWDWRV